MRPDILTAWRGSKKKWERILAGKGKDRGELNCPLCAVFTDNCFDYMGNVCPVMIKTGEDGCAGSPYEKWLEHHGKVHGDKFAPWEKSKKILCPTCRKIAESELRFLESLLPEVCNNIEHFRNKAIR